ncbi:MAG: hypothetical protein Q8Q96_00305 [bacterium]|nr:hypothetical protein [bacterium]
MTDGPPTPENNGEKAKTTEIRHPYKDDKTTLESYLPFVQVADGKLKERFVRVLRKLFVVTGTMWRPGWCYSTERLEEIVKQLKAMQFPEIEFTPMNWTDGHFYLTAKFKDSDENLIIDPFGVPTPSKDYYRDRSSIVPFFGELELAPFHHQRIYSAAKPVNERGYHRFHP